MKTIKFDLNDDVATVNTYDKTKTSIYDGVHQKTINSNLVLGPSINRFLDTQSDAGLTPNILVDYTPNGRVFVCNAPVGGSMNIVLYNLNQTTGSYTYVGKCVVTLPNTAATTHTSRSFKVLDNGTSTGWKILIGTVGSVAINGGVFMVNKVDEADFGPVSFTTFSLVSSLAAFAVPTTNAKGVYFLQDPAALGVSHVQTQNADFILDRTNSMLYSHNGVSATHQYYKYDLTQTPSIAGGLQTFTVTIASPGVVTCNAHGYSNNDQVTLTTSGALPTGLAIGATYFVRNATANTFELSATTGGASINTSGTQSGTHQVLRSFGITSSMFSLKTGNLPALTGTLLLLNSGNYVNATDLPANISLQNQPCAFFGTSSNLYIGKLSELTSGVTAWASLTTVNLLGTVNEFTAPTALQVEWMNELNTAFIVTNTAVFIAKKFINNQILSTFGSLSTQYLEGFPSIIPTFGMASITGVSSSGKWLLIAGSTVGQRGIIATPIGADSVYGSAKIITKVVEVNKSQFKSFCTLEELYDISTTNTFYYRTGAVSDTMFNSASGGWLPISIASDLSSIYLDEAIQLKIESWDIMGNVASNASQISDIKITVIPTDENSDHWKPSVENTSKEGDTPFYIAFRLQNTYATSVPALRVQVYDDSNNVVLDLNTTSNPTLFEYSTNNGTSWNALGTIPNTALTTEVRITVTSPTGNPARARIIEL